MLAGMTGFRRRIPAVNLHEGTSVPLGFVFQLADKLAPSHITNGFAQLPRFGPKRWGWNFAKG